MTDRRKFIKDAAGALAGIAFTGCSLLGAAQALSRLIALEDHLLERGWVESYYRVIVARKEE